jgi:mannose-6-phosphate isomerase-like protein (cupin superfamily)
MEFLTHEPLKPMSSAGITALSLLSLRHASEHGVEIARVLVEPGALLRPQSLPGAEQVWVGVCGVGLLLLADRQTRCFSANEVVRFAHGDLHGFQNTGQGPFIYLSVTFAPIAG